MRLTQHLLLQIRDRNQERLRAGRKGYARRQRVTASVGHDSAVDEKDQLAPLAASLGMPAAMVVAVFALR